MICYIRTEQGDSWTYMAVLLHLYRIPSLPWAQRRMRLARPLAATAGALSRRMLILSFFVELVLILVVHRVRALAFTLQLQLSHVPVPMPPLVPLSTGATGSMRAEGDDVDAAAVHAVPETDPGIRAHDLAHVCRVEQVVVHLVLVLVFPVRLSLYHLPRKVGQPVRVVPGPADHRVQSGFFMQGRVDPVEGVVRR